MPAITSADFSVPTDRAEAIAGDFLLIVADGGTHAYTSFYNGTLWSVFSEAIATAPRP